MNDPFQDYMSDSILEEALKKTKNYILLGTMNAVGMDKDLIHILELLMNNGCPADTIVKTMKDLVEESKNAKRSC